jgi:hypothetical protein
MTTPPSRPRLGQLLRDQELISQDELAEALRAHEETGRPLGEVITDMLGLLTISEMRDMLLLQRRWRPLGQLVLERGLVTEGELLEALDDQERTGRPLGEVLRERYRLSSTALDAALREQRELEVELDRGYTSGLREALQRRARVRTVKAAEPEPSRLATFGLAERLMTPIADAHTHLAVKHIEAGEKKIGALNTLVLEQREELAELRSALYDRQLTIIELEERVRTLDELLAGRAAPGEAEAV